MEMAKGSDDNFENEFLCGLIELQYGRKVEKKLKKISSEVRWAKSWPSNKEAFWNAEAFMWGRKVDGSVRETIKKELEHLNGGRNLDLGCGAYSYIPSVGFDISGKMLSFNENLKERVKGSLEGKLPFASGSFDSVTAVFVLNYVENIEGLLLEARRVLKKKGVFAAVLYSGQINEWQRQKEVNHFSFEEWKKKIGKEFLVQSQKEGKLWLFEGLR
jgi:ubiquinone/menaquinone biosynthesis C-methylase UbiE